ncbi:sugar phosphate isomerase [Marinilactibacillus sp. 15R]|uniref:Ribose-5-phosphate isomerase n=1 Tax=Marinilactibacillus piezotolerans TaxID=258723 RepID=A0A1I4AJE5_9LACT|nr:MULTISPECIES: RpiB/LacA/LacB family sugar-phosphate isomerase [Marinilactibacillus]API89815.1 sugar phosphate isomerase [Marinilactibacillus sp. 15R]SFK55846.1 ribose-5-phosphate isomerase [Marinilactibacillus piezotolerans]
MEIGIGADHNAFEAKEELKNYLTQELGHEVRDYGCYSVDAVDYPGIAFKVGEAIINNEVERGILICGTGIGVAISANKIPGIRAAQVHDPYSAERAQLSNNAQIITFGAKIIGVDVMKHLVKEYLSLTFKGGNSGRKVEQIMEKEKENYATSVDNFKKC